MSEAIVERQLHIRMYNTGFGDCFLLRLPSEGRQLKVLIDCGKHTLSTCKPPLAETVPRVLDDLAEGEGGAGPRVDLLVCTHRHLDHVSGFKLPGWEKVRVGEVWMPWVEDPDDAEARRICKRQSTRALQLVRGIEAHPALAAEAKENLLSYAGNNLTNEAAMRVLHEGFAGKPPRRFLPRPQPGGPKLAELGLVPAPTLPGVEVYVLGPSRSDDVIRDMDPPPGEAYLQALLALGPQEPDAAPESPFSSRWAMSRQAYQKWYTDRGLADPVEDFPEKAAERLAQIVEDPAGELAASLESSINGTSLVLVFKVGPTVLLFPGDAQWGTWNDILSDERWRRLLQSVAFYKVGHHGSHNATPSRFVENYLPADAFAMIPTDAIKKWPLIPKSELLTSLARKKVRFLRGDLSSATDDPLFKRVTDGDHTVYVDLALPC